MNEVGGEKSGDIRRRLVLVISEELEASPGSDQRAPGSSKRGAHAARKAFYRQTGEIQVVIDDARRRQAVSEALALWGTRPVRPAPSRRRAIVALAVLLCLAASVFPIHAASRSSLPGQPLWPVKRVGESVRQWLARGPREEARAALATTAERLREAQVLAADERFEAAREALGRFYREFEVARRRLRAVSREDHSDVFAESDRQLSEAAELDNRLSGEAAHSTSPKGPEAVGTLSPTPKPPWEPENPRETAS